MVIIFSPWKTWFCFFMIFLWKNSKCSQGILLGDNVMKITAKTSYFKRSELLIGFYCLYSELICDDNLTWREMADIVLLHPITAESCFITHVTVNLPLKLQHGWVWMTHLIMSTAGQTYCVNIITSFVWAKKRKF